jgi:hypothetical protein
VDKKRRVLMRICELKGGGNRKEEKKNGTLRRFKKCTFRLATL